jgi:hypothetical protein
MIDAMDLNEMRLWCLRGLAFHPELFSEVDGTLFMAGECGNKIFQAMRAVYESGQAMTATNVGHMLGYDSVCLIGVVDVFTGVKVTYQSAETYIRKLEYKNEEIANDKI